MKTAGALLSALAILGAGTPALAQTPRPADVSLHSRLPASDRARFAIVSYAECLIAANRAGVRWALGKPADDDSAAQAYKTIAQGDCLRGGDISMPNSLLRGGLYIGLYRVDFDASRAAPALAATSIDFSQDVARPTENAGQQYVALRTFADCVVRANPASSRALVLATVGSPIEAEAFRELGPQFSQCLPKDVSLTFSKGVLTGLVAEVLYRESVSGGMAPVARRS